MSEDKEEVEITKKRKDEGIKVLLEKEVKAEGVGTWLEYVKLIHNALPELNLKDVSTRVEFLGREFSAPIMIDCMTGGSEYSLKINENLAYAAEEFNIPMGVGSQRAGLKSKELIRTYSIVREVAPSAFMMANIGAPQLSQGFGVDDARRIVEMIKADALVIHLNPLQELIQPEGEPSSKGVLAKISELTKELKVPIIVKEVGTGISREVALKLEMAGVSAINIAGLGGTNWALVEKIRAKKLGYDNKVRLGKIFADWGIPTAASLIEVKRATNLPVIASGGIRSGLDVAKCLVLGANICAMALPLLKAAVVSKDEVIKLLKRIILELKATMYLVGAKDITALKKSRYVIFGALREWLEQL